MKTAPSLSILALSALLCACSANPPPSNVTYNNHPSDMFGSPPPPSVNTGTQTGSANTFYTAPVKTPVQ